jgi:hypothetical protein
VQKAIFWTEKSSLTAARAKRTPSVIANDRTRFFVSLA